MVLFNFSDYQLNNLRGKIKYIHSSFDHSSAFQLLEEATVSLKIPRYFGAVRVFADFYTECLDRVLLSGDFVWDDTVKEFDIYSYKVNLSKLGVGIYFFKITIETQNGRIFCTPENDEVVFSRAEASKLFQISVVDFKYDKPTNKYGGIIYHIFVDRFARGGEVALRDGAVLVDDWSMGIPEYPLYPGAHLINNTFYGGTLYGIVDKLEYIASLGVNLIYLSPIFSSPSNHKYDTSDYMSVDSMFGSIEALKLLIDEAHKLGIGIILDGVFNHTGADSIYFNKKSRFDSVGAYQSKSSPYFDWFNFELYPDKYTCWWDIDILPRINTENPKCREYFVGADGVISKYASLGIDGFRLDVADELSDEFISLIKSRLNEYNSNSLLYGEVWEDASNKISYGVRKTYYLGCELDGVMNYPLRKGLIDYILTSNTGALKYALTEVMINAPKRIADVQMNLLGTHDTERILTVLGGESSRGLSNSDLVSKRLSASNREMAIRKLKMAYTALATLPGVPSIFYGDEAGLEGYSDPFNRMPYPWGNECSDLIDHYRNIGRIRRENCVYREGEFSLVYLESDVFVFSRKDSGYAYVTVMNNSGEEKLISFNNIFICLDTDKTFKMDSNDTVDPYSSVIYKVKVGSKLTLFDKFYFEA